jgi:nucleoside-diphosphate-sugar epimerase
MRVFVTGASGFIGSAVVQELLKNGHQVLGLARSDDSARAVEAAGAQVLRGDLENVDALKSGAAACDGVAHLAFIHDFSKYMENAQIDKRAIEAMGEAMAGSNKPLVVAGGLLMLAPGQMATEDTPSPSASMRHSEATADAVAARGVRASTIRLSPTVHGAGDKGFVPMLIAAARDKGLSAYVGDGTGRWPAVHRHDAASLFRLALEKGSAGAKYHGSAEGDVPTRAIAELIGRRLSVPVESKTPEEAMAHFGFLGMALSADSPASSAKTQAELGWRPTGPELLADMEAHYFGA